MGARDGKQSAMTQPVSRHSAESRKKAEEYLAKHRLLEVLNDLCASLCFAQPENVKEFLIKELDRRKTQGAEAGMFEPKELDSVFSLADLMGAQLITEEQCRKALLSLASSQKQFDAITAAQIPKEVDRLTFMEKAKSLLALDGRSA